MMEVEGSEVQDLGDDAAGEDAGRRGGAFLSTTVSAMATQPFAASNTLPSTGVI